MKFALKIYVATCIVGIAIGFILPWFTPAGREAAHTLAPFVGLVVCLACAFYFGRVTAKPSGGWSHFDRGYTSGYLRAIRDAGRAAREHDRKVIEGELVR